MGGGGDMAHASVPLRTAKDELAEARDRCLAAEAVDQSAVRKPILASWWRSRQWPGAPGRIEAEYLRDPRLASSLGPAAEPGLGRLHAQLDRQPVGLVPGE